MGMCVSWKFEPGLRDLSTAPSQSRLGKYADWKIRGLENARIG